MNVDLKTGLMFICFYVLMQIVMIAVTLGAIAVLEYQVSNSTGMIVSLIVGLQLTADRYARRHDVAPRGSAAILHALTFTIGIALVSGLSFLIPGIMDTLNETADPSALLVIGAVLMLVQFLIMWPAFPWFVRLALKK